MTQILADAALKAGRVPIPGPPFTAAPGKHQLGTFYEMGKQAFDNVRAGTFKS